MTLRSGPNGEALTVLDMKELRPILTPDCSGGDFHPRLSYFAAVHRQSSSLEMVFGLGLYPIQQGAAPVVRLGIDYTLSSQHIRFSPSGNELAWGTTTGEVLVADLTEVNQWLTKVGLGW